MERKKIINLAVIAHVDAGKSTLVDALLKQSHVFRENQVVQNQVMDSNDLERERGITIYSKNCSIYRDDLKINIVDTPGHADFTSEVERIMMTVDTVILLVDSSEGPMPQTRVVLNIALKYGLKPILFINKIDKKDARSEEVVDETFDLFDSLGASLEQLDFPVIYGVAKEGKTTMDLDEELSDLTPLFKCIREHVKPYPNRDDEPLQMQVSNLKYDEYLGRLGSGRITRGILESGKTYSLTKRSGEVVNVTVAKVFVNQGISRVNVKYAVSGDIVLFSGVDHIQIGETLCDIDHVEALPMIHIEEPTLSMNFFVNDSPFAGREGKYVTNRHLRSRLYREKESNVGLRIEDLGGVEGYKVSGRGELHLSILIENMRREGYELSVSKPEVLFKRLNGQLQEPYEKAIVNVPDNYTGTVITQMSERKGTMKDMSSEGGYTKIEFYIPTRGLIGYRSQFINSTKGEGSLQSSFTCYDAYAGDFSTRQNGVCISGVNGKVMTYSIFKLQERAKFFVHPADEVYEGQIVGMNSKTNDLVVNPTKNKRLSAVRSAGTDEAMRLDNIEDFTLERALEFINDDELVEVTPKHIRMRKKILNLKDRIRSRNNSVEEEE